MTVRRSLALLILIGLLAAGLLWFLNGAEPTAASGGGEQRVADAAAASLSPMANSAGAVALEREAAPAEETGAPERSLTVLVIQAQDGSAVAGAEVLLLPLDGAASLPADQQEEYLHANADERLDRWGRVFRCDESGHVRVPVPEINGFPVGARSQGHWGRQDVRNAKTNLPEEIEIELRRAINLRVLVVDESRRPVAGVPVVYRRLYRKTGDDFAETLTDEQGLARLPHLQDAAMRPYPECDEHVVALGVATDPTVQAAFNPRAPPTEPIVLVLPATGSVEISVLNAAGEPAPDELVVVLQTVVKVGNPSATPHPELFVQGSQGSRTAKVQSGLARFERVGIGLELEFGADFSSTGYIERRIGSGPQRAGEVVHFVLRRKEEDPVLSGRVVDEDALPVANRDLEAAIIRPGERALHQAQFRLRTDAAGRFHAELPNACLKTGLTHLLLKDATPGRIRVAVADFTSPLPLGATDLGDLLLGGPLLVSGIAVDEENRPRSEAKGRIDLEQVPDPVEQAIKGPFNYLSWQAGEDGRFEVRGAFPAGRYRINGNLDGAIYGHCAPEKFEPGTSDLILQFRHLRGIYGRVMVDEPVPADGLHLSLERKGEAVVGWISPEGNIEIHPRNPGVFNLVFRTQENGSVVRTLPDITVDPAQYLDLGQIDLRGHLVATRISVAGPVGVAEKYGRTKTKNDQGSWILAETPFPHTVLCLDRDQTCWIEVGGFMLTEVRLDGLEKTVPLSAAQRAVIQVDELPPCPAGSSWNLSLRATAENGRPTPGWFGARLDANGRAEVIIHLDGLGPLGAELRWNSPDTGSYALIPGAFGDPPASIELTGTSLRQEFRLLADAAVISRAIGKE